MPVGLFCSSEIQRIIERPGDRGVEAPHKDEDGDEVLACVVAVLHS